VCAVRLNRWSIGRALRGVARRGLLWRQNSVSRKQKPPQAETRFECGTYRGGRPSIWRCWDHSASKSARQATPMPWGD